jgi:hypothetical protein
MNKRRGVIFMGPAAALIAALALFPIIAALWLLVHLARLMSDGRFLGGGW